MILPAVYAILDIKGASVSKKDRELLDMFLKEGFEFLQIRAKQLSDLDLRDLCREVIQQRDRLSKSSKIIVNDRADIAGDCGADGVHLGQEDMSPAQARELLGPQAIIGLSTHTVAQANAALAYEVHLNYLALGPIFESGTKSGHAATTGCGTLAEVCKLSSLPVVAIGGITLKTAPKVFESGAKSIALIGELEAAAALGPQALQQTNEHYRALAAGTIN
jgi:thiamine-phosphate pyrophosphorylase